MRAVQKGNLIVTARQEVDYRVRRPDLAVPVEAQRINSYDRKGH